MVKIPLATWKALIHARKCDVILATDPVIAGVPALIAAKLMNKPFILRLVGNFAWEHAVRVGWLGSAVDIEEFQQKRFGLRVELLRFIQEFVAHRADFVIVPSNYNKRLWAGWGIPENKFRLVSNAVEPPTTELTRDSLGLPSNQTIVLTIGRLYPFKRVDKIIECMAAHKINALLVVIGEGDQERNLKELAQRLKVDALFLGRQPHEKVLQFLSVCDAFVLYSSYEGQSHLLLEAMAAGAPVLASDLEPNRELIEDGVNGLLVDSHDLNQLADRLKQVLSNQAFARELVKNAKQKVKGYSWGKLADATLAVFEEAQGMKQ